MHLSKLDPLLVEPKNRAKEILGTVSLPGLKEEAWKYTPASLFTNHNYKVIQDCAFPDNLELQPNIKQYASVQGENLLVFYNGQYVSHLSSGNEEKGLHVTSLSRALSAGAAEKEELIKVLCGGLENLKPEPKNYFKFENGALFEEGAYIAVDGVKEKIHLLHIYNTESEPHVFYPKIVVSLKGAAQVEILESHINKTNGPGFSNISTQVYVSEGSELKYATVKRGEPAMCFYHSLDLWLKGSSHAAVLDYSAGSKLIRNDVTVVLGSQWDGVGLYGAYLGSGKNHIDNYTSIRHEEGQTESRQIYKGLLKDKSQAVFTGHLFIEEDAQKSDASQLNQNLLLSDHAQVNTRPQLEVLADDVKAAHGATIGAIQEEALFYLMSRGFTESQAKETLSKAYVSSVIKELESEFLEEKVFSVNNEFFESNFLGA